MNETPFKFTSEEKEQTLQILERLRTAVGDTFKPGDEQHLREDIQHAFINHQIKRNVFGMNPILAALQTAEIAVNEIGLKRDGIIAILMQTSVIDGYQTIEEIQKKAAKEPMEEKMACGVGACLACVCQSTEVDGHSHVHNKRICKDGPVFLSTEIEL